MISLFSLSNLRRLFSVCIVAEIVLIAVLFAFPAHLAWAADAIAAVCLSACVCGLIGLYRYKHYQNELCETVLAAAQGQLGARINHRQGSGQLANLQNAVNQLLDQTEAFSKEAAAAMHMAANGDYYRKILPLGLRGDLIGYADKVNAALDAMDLKTKDFHNSASRIGDDIQSVAGIVSTSARQLSSNSDFLSRNVHDIAGQAQEMRRAAEESSEALNGIASATEQFSGSIRNIGTQIQGAAQLTKAAVAQARTTGDQMVRLDELANRVTKVIELITDVSHQTNLLALNATIEAARAGDVGKGFAVVANEVKNLANQTSDAAENVIREISEMQVMTREAVVSVRDINDKISEIDNSARRVAEATSEQTAVVVEISARIDQAVSRMEAIVAKLGHVATGTHESGEVLSKLHGEATSLLGQAQSLDNDVHQFVAKVVGDSRKEIVVTA
ncbi:methyl-accepting chemotaxis protein [Thalassospira sp. MA62]|nr:methyl-accepting chemotaxis protein [Thalassospira sp. MA62]